MIFVGLLGGGIFIAFQWRNYWEQQNERLKADFEGQLKTRVYSEILRAWNKSTNYQPAAAIDVDEFRQSALHPDFSDYTGDDFCVGVLPDGRRFRFSEIVARRLVSNYQDHMRVTNSSYYDNESYRTLVFKGLFFVLEDSLPYEGFKGRLQIAPKTKEKAPQSAKKKPKPVPKNTPKKYNESILDADLDSFISDEPAASKEPLPPLFDRLFELQAAHPERIRQRLTPEFCEQINQLRFILQQPIALSFHENKVYFSLRQSMDFLPITVEHTLLSDGRINYLTNNFRTVFRVLDALARLTTRKP
jgi:hypothetical protein